MYILDFPWLRRIYNVLRIVGIVFFLGCQSEPIVLNPPGGYEYQFHSFPIDFNNSASFQVDPKIGSSSRLYTGIINNQDTVYTLIRLLPSIISDHEVCNADSKDSVSISLFTLDTIATQDGDSFVSLFDEDAFNIYSVNLAESWTIESNIEPSDAVTIINAAIESSALDFTYQEKALIIEFSNDEETISQWCGNSSDDIGLLFSYLPDADNIDEDKLSFIEFYSSDINFNVEKKPTLNFSYKKNGDTTIVENRYAIDLVSIGSSPANLEQPYMIIQPDSANWGRLFAYNIPGDDPPALSNFIESIQDRPLDDIILEPQTGSVLELIKVNISRNESDFHEIDSIAFWLDNAKAYKSAEDDPAGDDSTDGNQVFDWEGIDENGFYIKAEYWYDYGIDGCVDSLESGDGCVISSDDSPYKLEGTEGNRQLDWTDNDGDGIWSAGDSGERWWDWGSDWCPDSLENGDGPCLADTVATGPKPCNCSSTPHLLYDQNKDNFDPSGDDWHAINKPDSTEGNKQWDPGEPFYDWGYDMIPAILTFGVSPDDGEDDGVVNWNDYNGDGDWDDGEGEQWFDTGSDGKANVDEVDNYYSTIRTEGNYNFDSNSDSGERYLDCGIGEDQFNLDCEDYGDDCYCLEDFGDDLDPNQDNWDEIYNPDGTEGNKQWDEDEEFEDDGYDHLTDAEETFISSQELTSINNGLAVSPANESKISIDTEVDTNSNPQPDLGSSQAAIWISDINKIEGEYSWEIIVSVYTTVALQGLQFQLKHIPLTWHDTIPLSKQVYISQIEEKKLYQDITLQPNMTVPDDDSLKNNLIINYSSSLATILNFDGLKDTLDSWEELIFSHEYSNLVMFIDTDESDIHDNGMYLFLGYTDMDSIYVYVSADADSIEFPVSQIMAGFQNGSNGTYQDFKLMTNSILHNYSTLSILFNSEQPTKNPRLDIMYTQ